MPVTVASISEVIASHAYPSRAQDFAELAGLGMGREEVAMRFVRTANFFTPKSCFQSVDQYKVCCDNEQAYGSSSSCAPAPAPRMPSEDLSQQCPFHALETQSLCCFKEHFRDVLFSKGQQIRGEGRDSWLRTRGVAANSTRLGLLPFQTNLADCPALHSASSLGLVHWLHRWLKLPPVDLAVCIAGALAARLAAASAGEALEALEALAHEARSSCWQRRTLVVLRRNLLLWRHRARGAGLWMEALERNVWRVLRLLEVCRSTLNTQPVLQLHVPKTAGISLCLWAESAGFRARRFFEQRCHVRGDGPFWLGEPALPLSCSQRIRKLSQTNSSWMSVERWVDLPLCEELQYVVVLREPITRTVHHFRHILLYFSTAVSGVTDGVDVGEVGYDLFGKFWAVARAEGLEPGVGRAAPPSSIGAAAGLADWVGLWLGCASNYQVRALAGAGRGHAFLEEAQAAERRLGAAMQTLEQLDVVFVLGEDSLLGVAQAKHLAALLSATRVAGVDSEQPSEDASLPEFIAYSHNHGVKGPMPLTAAERMWARRELRRLRQLNAADRALVKYASLLQALDEEYLRVVLAHQPR